MIFGAALGVAHDAFEEFEHFLRRDLQAGFFQDSRVLRRFQSFAGFDQAAGEGPVAFERVAGALRPSGCELRLQG